MSLQKIKIKSEKPIGIQPVYDICVPGAHHYLLDSGTVSHNSGFIYASSIVVAMGKLKLKEDEDGAKIADVTGIRSNCKVVKTRYAKPFETVQVKIPYTTGMSPYSGLVDLFDKRDILKKDGNRLSYIASNGDIIKKYRKDWESNDEGCLDRIMAEYDTNIHIKNIESDTSDATTDDSDDHAEAGLD